jgi:hypothetical protein
MNVLIRRKDRSKKVTCPYCKQSFLVSAGLQTHKLSGSQQNGEERAAIQREVESRLEQVYRRKLLEKDRLILSLQEQFEEGRRKAAQGSQQAQGEVAELDLEQILRAQHRYDFFHPVHTQGDLLQEVYTQRGNPCGKILWESKDTKHWQNAWLKKAKQDQQARQADLVVIVSSALPEGFKHFDLIENVWVTSWENLVGVAAVLRAMLVKVAKTAFILESRVEANAALLDYMTSPAFKSRMQLILKIFSEKQNLLERRKAHMNREWAKEARQNEELLQMLVEMSGEIEGILEMNNQA